MSEKRKTYPYNADVVFNSLKKVLSHSRFSVKNIDDSIKRIIATTHPSLFSYGESIEIIVQPEGEDKALVYIKSEPKVFFNITAGGAVERNIREIFEVLDGELR